MTSIKSIHGREVLDSRGNPTVEAEIVLASGVKTYASVPSGASTGSREAVELRDQDAKRYQGKGVLNAVAAINGEIQKCLVGQDVKEQEKLDQQLIELDGSPNKARLGANAILAVSLVVAKAAAIESNQPIYRYLQPSDTYLLPVPMMNIINGGVHANNNVDVQEFMILPTGAPTFSEALRYGAEVFHALKALLQSRGLSTAVGDEGGFAPDLTSNEAAIEMILEAITKAGYQAGKDIYLGLDVASSSFFQKDHYFLASENRRLSSEEFVDYLAAWVDKYPIISIEDGMDESDWHGWTCLSQRLNKQIQIVGDDLFVTNTQILQKGIDAGVANAILIKLNQIGTLTETIAAIQLAKSANYASVISHRSGETEEAFIADLAVATSVGQIKTGSLCRTDRIAKYNQLLRIEDELKDKAHYAGNTIFANYPKFNS